ncbi:MAG: ATP-binding protein [Candidatus Woesearchaeota archaeon]
MPHNLFERQAPALPGELAALRTAVWRHAMAQGATDETAQSIRLAVGEALTNVVMYAYVGNLPGMMFVRAWVDEDEHFNVQVLDEGHGLIPRADSPGLGLGMGLMAQMSADFRVANREGKRGTTVSMRFSLAGDPACACC